MDTSSVGIARPCLRWCIAVAAAGLLCACGRDMTGTYVGQQSETLRTSAAEQGRELDGASVTIEAGHRDEMVLRYGNCEIHGIVSPDGESAALSQASCPVGIADTLGEAIMFGNVSHRGSSLSVLVNGTLELGDERAVYTYRFEGNRAR